jgi:hypothetical protein
MSTPEKSCGPCRACCVALKIRAPELRKASGTPCPHLVPQGCGIYAQRPPVCRSFLCGWRLLPELDGSWRPDLAGVMLLRLSEEQLSNAYRGAGPGWVLVILDGEKALTLRLAKFAARLVKRNAAVFISAMTPRLPLNAQLQAPVAAGDMNAVLAVLRRTHDALLPARDAKGLGRIWALYRAQVDRMRATMRQRRP